VALPASWLGGKACPSYAHRQVTPRSRWKTARPSGDRARAAENSSSKGVHPSVERESTSPLHSFEKEREPPLRGRWARQMDARQTCSERGPDAVKFRATFGGTTFFPKWASSVSFIGTAHLRPPSLRVLRSGGAPTVDGFLIQAMVQPTFFALRRAGEELCDQRFRTAAC